MIWYNDIILTLILIIIEFSSKKNLKYQTRGLITNLKKKILN